MFMSMGNRPVTGRPGSRMRAVLPAVPVEKETLAGLKEQMSSASEVEAKAVAVRTKAAAEYQRRMGQKAAEKTLREQSGQSTRNSRVEMEVAIKLKELPKTGKAFEDGQISYGHTRIIAKTAGRVEIDEQKLLDAATVQPVDVFAHTARQHERERSGDDGKSLLERQRQNRVARIKTDTDDGMTVLYARFDPVTGARVKTVLSNRVNQLWRAEDPKNRLSPEQRMADALAGLLCRTGDSNGKSQGTTLLLMADYDVISQQIRDARLGDGTPVPVEVFKELACEAKILPAIFDTRGQPLWVGRAKRLATPAQRMVLIARDRGCVGCGADPTWCQAHHITPWAAGGPTDLKNLCLLCSRCHHQVHDDGWQIQQTPNGEHLLQAPPRGSRRPPPIRTPHHHHRRRPTTKLLL